MGVLQSHYLNLFGGHVLLELTECADVSHGQLLTAFLPHDKFVMIGRCLIIDFYKEKR